MTTANFEQLCTGLCEVAGMPAPDFTMASPGPDDTPEIEVCIDEKFVILSDEQVHGCPNASIAVRLGALPVGDELEACRRLMDINVDSLNSRTAFARDFSTGDIVLVQAYMYEDGTPIDLYQRILRLVAAAEEWRSASTLHSLNFHISPSHQS